MFQHQQEMDAFGRVRSIQSLSVSGEGPVAPAVAAEAGELYWTFLRRIGLGILRVRQRPDGGVDVGALGLLLLAFAAPVTVQHEGGFAVRYGIRQGAVVQRQGHDRGFLQVGLSEEWISLTVEGYHPALVGVRRHPLRVALYRATQSTLHLLIARAFLAVLRRWVRRHRAGRQ